VLDLFCSAGGATKGYQVAGHHVTGVDIARQPNYCGDAFVQADAIGYAKQHGHEYDLIHASPPCQAYSNLNHYNHIEYPDLIAPTRSALVGTGVPYVIENIPRAPLVGAVMLCGQMFGLRLYRHRNFESGNGIVLRPPRHPAHVALCTRNSYLPTPDRPYMTITGGKHSAAWQRTAAHYLGVPWMRTIAEVCEAIPPAYTYWIARQL
jgi:DNA (cytosine-5)-methyltransferase 1